MATGNARIVRSTPDDVFAVFSDGWLYPVWVVGAARMRDVTGDWPQAGAEIHHSLGIWPVLIDDRTEVVEWDPPRRLRLRARIGPFGRAVVVVDVRPRGDHCIVRMGEEPVAGLAARVPQILWAPIMRLRNTETLRRLAFLAEGRAQARLENDRVIRDDVPAEEPGPQADPEAREDVAEADEAHDAAENPEQVDPPEKRE